MKAETGGFIPQGRSKKIQFGKHSGPQAEDRPLLPRKRAGVAAGPVSASLGEDQKLARIPASTVRPG